MGLTTSAISESLSVISEMGCREKLRSDFLELYWLSSVSMMVRSLSLNLSNVSI